MFDIDKDTYRTVKKSKLINAKWYLEVYPDVASVGMDPILHYLKYGWRMGRNPCRRFDTRYYLDSYPDIKSSGKNPLLHYIKYGIHENRKINRDASSDKEAEIKDRIVAHLWGGHSRNSLFELQKIYNSEEYTLRERTFAAWHASRWFFFIDEYKAALEIAFKVREIDEEVSYQKRFVMLFTFCYLKLNDKIKARAELERYLAKKPNDSDALLAFTNTVGNDDELRIDYINRIFEESGFLKIRKIEEEKPLSMGNITAHSPEHAISNSEKVSIIMPIYNAEEYIDVAIRGLLEQTWQNIEIIAVDDRSTDNTFEKLKEWSEKDNRVIPILQEKNGGAYVARNSGLKIASGDYITTHDSDDWSHPQKIEVQVKYLQENSKKKGVITYWVRALENLVFTQNWRLNSELVHWSHSSFLFRKELMEKLGSWDRVLVGGDTEFIWRAEKAFGTWAIKKIKKTVPFSFSLDDETSLTRTKATHVKTIHFGLRHTYREACMWWHKNANSLKLIQNSERKFFAPTRMLDRTSDIIKIKKLYIADFSKKDCSQALFKYLISASSENRSQSAMFHWPDTNKIVENLHDGYFSMLKLGINAICAGEMVEVEELVIVDEEAVKHMLDALPIFVNKKMKISFFNKKNNSNSSSSISLDELLEEIYQTADSE
ncbi:glycosyltransferase family 2 protein [Vreelandella malpeensis]|uniref:Glycosyltransferase family 2 protein n=1 Tax=Vreelandella malpeensis TaxID=1172368 RepID=A0ABS8DTC1_9GAMM|nr:glycosyltransferase family A protein [Halomonas malpeensis]MCB8889542.1 glycosyltransferase family 2 protein [Halomonas malpeensis]